MTTMINKLQSLIRWGSKAKEELEDGNSVYMQALRNMRERTLKAIEQSNPNDTEGNRALLLTLATINEVPKELSRMVAQAKMAQAKIDKEKKNV